MINIGETLLNLWNDSGFARIITGFISDMGWQNLVMIAIGCFLLYLAIKCKFEPLLLTGIAFGCILANLPGAGLYNQQLWDNFMNADHEAYHSYGTILKVNVQNGQAVKSGTVLCVLEAMKMENEILAPKDGTVTQVLVSKGASVDTGAPLVVIG